VPGHELAQRGEAGRAQNGPLGVDVVARRRAARQDDVADYERVRSQLRDQPVGRGTLSVLAGDRLVI
jgi:hypothetical protein